MKRKETKIIEQVLYGNLFGTNPKLAKEYGTEEVPIGFARGGRINNKIEVVDFLSYDMKKDWFRCYEIKVSMSDFKCVEQILYNGIFLLFFAISSK